MLLITSVLSYVTIEYIFNSILSCYCSIPATCVHRKLDRLCWQDKINLKNYMQQAGKKRLVRQPKKLNQSFQTPSLSSFNLVHRFGKIEIVRVVKPEKKEDYFKIPDFPGWSMPEHPIGYIKCKDHDFL